MEEQKSNYRWIIVISDVSNDDQELPRIPMVCRFSGKYDGPLLVVDHLGYRLEVKESDVVFLDELHGASNPTIKKIRNALELIWKVNQGDPPSLHSTKCMTLLRSVKKDFNNPYPEASIHIDMAIDNINYYFTFDVGYHEQGVYGLHKIALAVLIFSGR